MLNEFIELNKKEIIEKTSKLIQISSVYEKSNDSKKPFGENVNLALEYMLNLGKELGFKTKNVDGYCGYIEFGEGKELIGIIGHLDVVPSGEGWIYPAFSGEISEGRIWGRGTVDNKGPMIASLYAMKAIMDNMQINKRVRLILGLNEENDWKCIEYYKTHEEIPSIGFSPDANFPCIYAEKSILTTYFSELINNEVIEIVDVDCNNNPINVVPKFCSITIKFKGDIDIFIQDFKENIDKNNVDIEIYKIDNNSVKLTSHGIAAHAAHPELGLNAISVLLVNLYEVLEKYNISLKILEFFYKHINLNYNGENLGISCMDETGELTLNVGQINLENSILKIGLNIRIPVKTKSENVESNIEKVIEIYEKINIEHTGKNPSLYISKEDWLVKTLCNIFNDVTGRKEEAIAIGGATYARTFKNFVSFGPTMPEDEDMCHKVNEFIEIDKLILSSKIYAKAIIALIEK